MDVQLNRINTICRMSLAFIFFYHGIVPKILWLSSTETALLEAHSFLPAEVTVLAGISEIILAFILILYRSATLPVYLAAAGLIALLIDVAVVMPELLVEAFNPVTTNIAALAICYVILLSGRREDA